MKFKFMIPTAVAAVMMLASCSNDNGKGGEAANGTGDIHIKMSQLGSPEGRAVTDPFDEVNDVYTTFHHGGLFFADNAGAILHAVIVGTDAGASVSPSDLATGYTFASISERASRVVVIANHKFTPTSSFTTLADLYEDYPTDLTEQVTDGTGVVDDELGIDYAVMWGEGNIRPVTGKNWDREAELNITPIIARFEIKQLSAAPYTGVPVDPKDDGIDDGFVVEGIFVNNYYYEVGLDGKAIDATADLINWLDNYAHYAPAPGGKYEIAHAGITYDMVGAADGTASGNTVAAGTGKVWAYNAFVGSQVTPHIVIKLSGIAQNNTPRPNTHAGAGVGYLTVNRYVNLSDASAIYPMMNGVVYSIDDLEFTYSDITDRPEPSTYVSVNVKVNVLPWKVQKVGAGIDNGK